MKGRDLRINIKKFQILKNYPSNILFVAFTKNYKTKVRDLSELLHLFWQFSILVQILTYFLYWYFKINSRLQI